MSGFLFTVRVGALAIVCYGVGAAFAPRDDGSVEVTGEMIGSIAEQQEAIFGRALTDDERDQLVEAFIEEELLVREAYRLGLDRGDRRVRAMLIAQMRAEYLRELAPEDPDDRAVREYFEDDSERYRIPERIDLEHVLFPLGTMTKSSVSVLASLQGGADFRALGDAGPAASVSDVSRVEVANAYGLALADGLFSIDGGTWHGPFTSRRATHFFRIAARRPERDPNFDDVESTVREDLRRERERDVVDRKLAKVRRRYRVAIE